MYEAFLNLTNIWTIFYLMVGVFVGLIFGVLPALGGSAGLAFMLPFIFGMNPVYALPMMVGMLAVAKTGDTFPSILMGIPGSSSAQAIILDGFPMTQRGEGARALCAAFTGSMLGGIFGAFMLTLSVYAATPFLLSIGFPEQLMLVLLALTMVGTLTGASVFKGLASCGLGLLLGMVGTATATGEERLTFDTLYLISGTPLVVTALGIFALPEIVELVRRHTRITKEINIGKGWTQGIKDTFENWPLVLRCSMIGTLLGALPGLGGSVVNWVTYGHVVQTARDKSQFGHGDVRGVIGPESANNADEGGGLIPTLLFGVPGSGSMALLLAGFVLIGIRPGPEMVTTNIGLTFTMIWSLALANIIGTGTCILLARPIALMTLIRSTVIAPFMFAMIFFASFQATRSWWDLVALLAIGTLGTYMKRFGWPRPAFMIGFVLSSQLEAGIFRTVQIYGISFIERPVVWVLAAIAAVSIFAAVRFKSSHTNLDAEGINAPSELWPQRIFFLAAVAFALVMLFSSLSWDYATALFPRIVGLVTLITLLPIGIDMFRNNGQAHHTLFDAERIPVEAGGETRSNEYFLLWLVAMLVFGTFVGFLVAITTFVYAFLRVKASLSHWRCAVGAAGMLAVLAAIGWVLHLQYPQGYLQDFVAMPWPFN
jgi:TctA family transporter